MYMSLVYDRGRGEIVIVVRECRFN